MPERITHSFGEFSLDPSRRALMRGPDEVALTGKEFDLLNYLIKNRPEPCSHDELIAAIWETNVQNNAVERVVTRVRAALDDDQRDPRYIKTVRRRGYAFIAEVTNRSAPANGTDPVTKAHVETSDRRSWILLCLVGLVLVVAVAALAYWRSDILISRFWHERVFFDNFSTGRIDSDKWEVSGNGVAVENGIARVECLETDNCGRLVSRFFRIDPTKQVIVRSRTLIHYSDNLKGQAYLLGFFGLTMKRPGIEERDIRDVSINGIYYANYDVERRDPEGALVELPTEGWFLFRNGGSPASKADYATGRVGPRLTPYWDQWITQDYSWDPQSGNVSLAVDGKALGSFNVGPLPDDLLDNSIRIEVAPRGWWLYHRFEIDWIEVLQ
ncbi:MAG TPA: winged helix-turn-helix domain-containing protein [Pyrinomonadaceae bacterium]|nr:winged helix-turn-helix domain-containing protein [Pyrinomonadaceae bacterium]